MSAAIGARELGVDFVDRIQGLLDRLPTYQPLVVAVELAVIWVIVYAVVRFVQGTRAAGALKGLLIVVVLGVVGARLLGGADVFQRLGLLYDRFLAFLAIALIVIFQPELRRALVRLGETPFFRGTPKDIEQVVSEVAEAARFCARARFGALIVIERQVGLAGLVEPGEELNAKLSARLLQTIFFPGSALHDLAVVIKGTVIHAAGVQLPLADAEDMPDPSLGSRHRAAVGLTKECDAIVVVVSEETGRVRLAERGRLSEPLSTEELKEELQRRLTRSLRRARAGAAPAEPTLLEATGEVQPLDAEPGTPRLEPAGDMDLGADTIAGEVVVEGEAGEAGEGSRRASSGEAGESSPSLANDDSTDEDDGRRRRVG